MAEKGVKVNSALPLNEKTFYIDEVDVPKVKLKRLERSISLLGAKLEKFFTKEISYLITDHGQPADYKSRSHSTDGPSGSIPSPFSYTPNNLSTPPESAVSNPKPSASRASKMVNISHQQNSRPSSLCSATVSEQLVRNAKQWFIKMLQIDVALKWMEKKVVSLGLHKSRKTSSERSTRPPRSKAKVLKAPYIKIEDGSGRFRPVYRQFATEDVPVLNPKATLCPFEMRCTTGANAGATIAAEGSIPADLSEPAADDTFSSSKNDMDKVEAEKIDKGKGPAKSKSRSVVKRKESNSNGQVKKKLAFCMVCKVRYEDLEQHLRSDQHQQFTSNDNNYTAVDKLINSNASMQRFLDDIIKYHKEHQLEGLSQDISGLSQDISLGKPANADTTDKDTAASVSVSHEMEVTPTIDLIHRSVSDSHASSEPGDLGEDEIMEKTIIPATTLPQTVDISRTTDNDIQRKPVPNNNIIISDSRVEIKPRILPAQHQVAIKKTTPRKATPKKTTPKKTKLTPRKSQTGVINNTEYSVTEPNSFTVKLSKAATKKFAKNMSKVADEITKNCLTPVVPPQDVEVVKIAKSDILESEMSPSEIVKLRKRGKKKSSPVKSKSPKKVILCKSAKGHKEKQKQKPKDVAGMADIRAHWAILSDKTSNALNDSHGLPLDVSYGVLNVAQLENMAQQKTDVGGLGDDDRSLVESIHGYLDLNFNNNSSADEIDDPLFSCDSYLNLRISRQASMNSMMKPTTPRKSPRLSLGARDWTDEQFSPQKQKMSISIEKERRLSRALLEGARVTRLNMDRPVSDSFLSIAEIRDNSPENKENSPNVRMEDMEDSVTVLDLTADDNSISVFSNTLHNTSVHNLPRHDTTNHCNSSVNESINQCLSRKSLVSPNTQDVLPIQPQHVSTPADNSNVDLASKITSSNSASTATHSLSIKKSLFGVPSQQTDKSDGKPKPVTPVRISHKSIKSCAGFNNHRKIVIQSDPFGFDEFNISNVSSNKTPKRCFNRSFSTPDSKSKKKKRRPSKVDYERQSSLLSFGSVSLSQFDDVFSLPPDILPFPLQHLPTPSPSAQASNNPGITIKKRGSKPLSSEGPKYAELSDADLAAPGFKCNAKIRREAENARRIRQAGSTPKRKRSINLDSSKPEDHVSSPRTKDSLTSDHKKSQPRTPVKKCRARSREVCSKSPSKNGPLPIDDDSRNNCSQNLKHRKPAIAKEREAKEMSERDISTCSALTSDDEEPPGLHQNEAHSTPPLHESPKHLRNLTASARDYLLKHKYDYEVHSTGSKCQYPVGRAVGTRSSSH